MIIRWKCHDCNNSSWKVCRHNKYEEKENFLSILDVMPFWSVCLTLFFYFSIWQAHTHTHTHMPFVPMKPGSLRMRIWNASPYIYNIKCISITCSEYSTKRCLGRFLFCSHRVLFILLEEKEKKHTQSELMFEWNQHFAAETNKRMKFIRCPRNTNIIILCIRIYLCRSQWQ